MPAETPLPDRWDDEIVRLYHLNFDGLVRSATHLLGRRSAAEEVVQEAFLRYHTSTLRASAGKELPYLRSIVLNMARSRLRSERVAADHRRREPTRASSDETEWLRAIESKTAATRLAELPEQQRAVMTYRHIVGLSERETAERLSISTGSVKVHSSRARARMRLLLAG